MPVRCPQFGHLNSTKKLDLRKDYLSLSDKNEYHMSSVILMFFVGWGFDGSGSSIMDCAMRKGWDLKSESKHYHWPEPVPDKTLEKVGAIFEGLGIGFRIVTKAERLEEELQSLRTRLAKVERGPGRKSSGTTAKKKRR